MRLGWVAEEVMSGFTTVSCVFPLVVLKVSASRLPFRALSIASRPEIKTENKQRNSASSWSRTVGYSVKMPTRGFGES